MTSNDGNGDQPLVFGVPSAAVAAALRDAGLNEDAVVAVLGRAFARSAAADRPQDAATAGFTFQVLIAETAPECALSYERLFVHPDVIDGVTVVQGGSSPEDMGFNARFHAIEAEFDSISRDLHTSSNCVAELRREMFAMARELEAKLTEIDARIDAKGKDKEAKEGKETKEGKEGKETKEKDTKEGKDKEGKDGKERKEKDRKEADKIAAAEKLVAREKTIDVPLRPLRDEPTGPTGEARTFISLEDRPDVEAAALKSDEPTLAKKTAAKKTAAKKATAKKTAAKKTAAKKTAAKKKS